MTDVRSLRRRQQAGFTLIELMVAMTISLVLMMVLTSLFIDAMGNADSMMNKVALNQQARMMFDSVALGGGRLGINSMQGTVTTQTADVSYNYIFGLRGRAPLGGAGTGWARQATLMMGTSATGPYQYTLGVTPNNTAYYSLANTYNLTALQLEYDVLSSDPVLAVLPSDPDPGVPVTCTGVNQPVYGCSTVGDTVHVTGYLRMEPLPTTLTNVQELAFDLYNARFYGNNHVADDEISTVYWTAFTSLVDKVPQ